jgi:alkyldihydroxyacetonephosphate synthase
MAGERSWWGWGYEDAAPDGAAVRRAAGAVRGQLGFGGERVEDPAPLERVRLPAPRLAVPPDLLDICSTALRDRVTCSCGQAFRDVVRVMRGRVDHPTDVVARPRSEGEVARVLAWAADAGAAVVPHGGGTSVVGGIEPRDLPSRFAGVVTVDLRALNRVLEADPVSGAARIQAGATGPQLEKQLRTEGLSMRFYPQSFECSTLGGWVATRAAGHFATGPTRIDDLVESVRAITPTGVWQSRRLPSSGAGPSPDRVLLGSEGALGIITEAWVRVRPRPRCKATASVSFDDLDAGLNAVRDLVQSGLQAANCRLLDPLEAQRTAGGNGRSSVLVLGFESFDEPVGPRMRRALLRAGRHGARWDEAEVSIDDTGAWDLPERNPTGPTGTVRPRAAAAWRSAFLAMPYLRDLLLRVGVVAETLETAATWDRLPDLVVATKEAVSAAAGGPCHVSMRITHAYPDGAAPYLTVLVPARHGDEVDQWDTIKAAATAAILDHGGTVTHHHAVGRDHRVGYDAEQPEPFSIALRAAKAAIDPVGLLNPGVLLDPAPPRGTGVPRW